MNVLYEEEGGFKVGAVLADNLTSLQVEAPHGKRSKVKSASVLFRFDEPLGGFMERAQQTAEEIDLDFLWECSPQEEFAYETLAREYFGRVPSAPEAAALLLRLHSAPMYFYKKGKGRYRAAPADALKAALASVERKRQQTLLQAEYVEQLKRGELPDALRSQVADLLYRPDRNTLEVKALEEAATALKQTPLRLLESCGAISSTSDYHLNRFLYHHFPRGLASVEPDDDFPQSLPLADIHAFSIDDSTTTEIDDALSVSPSADGGWSIGIHIAAPALGIGVGSAVDRQAAARLSTIYMPGEKITMLPPDVAARYSLSEGTQRPVLSLYLDVAPDFRVRSTRTEIERIHIDANLRHDLLEDSFSDETLVSGGLPDVAFAPELKHLWEFSTVLEAGRGRPESARIIHMDYNFYVENDRVRIVERRRGSPVDRIVSEMMICANAHWGRVLADAQIAAIYRAQGNGKVRMSTVAAAHQGLGVAQYVWVSSPLRRYVDLINQRQLIAWHREEPPPYAVGSQALLTALHDFEQAYEVYADFQRSMERYWCLRWLLQEGVQTTTAEVFRENLVKIHGIPLISRVASLPALPPGAKVTLKISDIDLLEITFHAEYCGPA